MKIDVNPDWWKTLFDEVYLKTDARSVCDDEVTCREVDAVCALLPLDNEDAILDLCGGQGRHSLELARRGFNNCTVLDYSESLLEHGRLVAQQAKCQVNFVQGDAAATGLPARSYDHVLILGNSMGYMPESVDDLRIISEAKRLLKPGGCLLVDVTDGSVVREKFNPNAWHEIDEKIIVCRQRQLDENYIRAREVVLCKEQGLMRDQNYAIRLYSPEMLETLVGKAG
ncbi:MAG: class I SAM-dependent methyltransferase, partial [Gammaproteobacteria bacterium]|nr:class I SAM-dependent methyltransferase [Gammaproteobacteria bacterium]